MLAQGLRLGNRYLLTRRIAKGGMGEVWECTDTLLHRTVAVKALLPALIDDEQFITRFRAEARMMAALRHPGIVQIYDYGENVEVGDVRIDYLVMEYIEGAPLAQRIESARRLGVAETLSIVAQAAEALQVAHDSGIVHRDVKPSNLMVRADGAIVLVDFGIARSGAGNGTSVIIASPQFMAPEQAARGPVTPAIDVFALGAVAYCCLSGKPPFPGDDPVQVIAALMHGSPAPLPADVPGPVADLVFRALAKEPSQRPPSAAAFAAAARAASTTDPIAAVASPASGAGPGAWPAFDSGAGYVDGPDPGGYPAPPPVPAGPALPWPPLFPSGPVPPGASLPTMPTPPSSAAPAVRSAALRRTPDGPPTPVAGGPGGPAVPLAGGQRGPVNPGGGGPVAGGHRGRKYAIGGVAAAVALGLIAIGGVIVLRSGGDENLQATAQQSLGAPQGAGVGENPSVPSGGGSTPSAPPSPTTSTTVTPSPRPGKTTGQSAEDPVRSAPTGFYQLENANYDGYCLSANLGQSSSGAGTHSIYLVTCNPGADGQWWSVQSSGQLKNRLAGDGGTSWCLSGNLTTPPNGFSGTHGAYTSQCNANTAGQYWQLRAGAGDTWKIGSNVPVDGATWELSTTSSSPLAGGGYQVFTANPGNGSVATHLWRLAQP
ncbi:serine/threonine-protein kinase [Cryptosporangium phraense]|uniref:non-specific serine/threonine protein kinase n=1 Tax=Cryptosporangium phraense TaxID=2593070 RepID=A0A545AH69_9ACTN|nr:serine/threonine-protein kinase [Cryptosporangium phraense]TQS40664.1 protein kinase [Cryptosporangium phraense]